MSMEQGILRPHKVAKYGWRPDRPDARDHRHLQAHVGDLPSHVDLRVGPIALPAVYDQGELGSCTANGVGFLWQYALLKEGQHAPMPARLFIYFWERYLEGTINEDAGAEIRDGLKVLNKYGCLDEKSMPYNIKMFTKHPTQAQLQEALKHQAIQYASVPQNAVAMKAVLASGFPLTMGFTCYESFEGSEVARTGVLHMPKLGEKPIGGHCIAVVGYDDLQKVWIARNSWGTSWGQKGYFTVPQQYLLDRNLADDIWVCKMVEEVATPKPSIVDETIVVTYQPVVEGNETTAVPAKM